MGAKTIKEELTIERKEIKKDGELFGYLKRFKMKVDPSYLIEEGELNEKVVSLGDAVVDLLKKEELTYVDAYVTLEYVYKKLQLMSDYTHL